MPWGEMEMLLAQLLLSAAAVAATQMARMRQKTLHSWTVPGLQLLYLLLFLLRLFLRVLLQLQLLLVLLLPLHGAVPRPPGACCGSSHPF